MKNIILIFFFLFIFYNSADARYRQTCVVKYMTQEGWSRKYTVDVTFISGTELNEATNSFKYSAFSVYAVIFWGEGQASVIQISTFLVCGQDVDERCITNTIGDLKGKDQDGDEWKICVSDFCS